MKRAAGSSLMLLFGALTLWGCASKPVQTPPVKSAATQPPAAPASPTIEITYLRGMNSHSFTIAEENSNATIQCYRDHHLLKEIRIEKSEFSELAKESASVLAMLERHPAQKASPCRTPFTLKMKDEHEIRTIDGCRSTDEGAALGKLIKSVEFIMSREDRH